MEYKVVTLGAKVLSGKARREQLEETINLMAFDNWRLHTATPVQMPNFGWGKGTVQTEMVMIFERPKP
jgi:imidazoleglycerol phosphate synthase glutamine amidotransferase subunit HisH